MSLIIYKDDTLYADRSGIEDLGNFIYYTEIKKLFVPKHKKYALAFSGVEIDFNSKVFSNFNKEILNAIKIFEDGITGLSPKEAKGRKATNQEELNKLYDYLWVKYLSENINLISVIMETSGFSDIFGQLLHNCQAGSLYKIQLVLKEISNNNPKLSLEEIFNLYFKSCKL